MYHIGIDKDMLEGARYAVLPGDPGRVELIAKQFERCEFLAISREYTSYLGWLGNRAVLIMSTGMGGPSTAIALEELHMIGVNCVIRVGTCGGMQTDVMPGDLILVQGAIRQEGTGREYMPIEFPAVADFHVLSALQQAAEREDMPYHIGIVHCKDSFYGQHSPERMPVSPELLYKWEAWIKGGALASEMETAALYIVSNVLGMKAGAVMLCIWNQEREKAGLGQEETHDMNRAIKSAVKAVGILMEKEEGERHGN